MEDLKKSAKDLIKHGQDVLGTKGLIAAGLVSGWLLCKLGRKVCASPGKPVKDDIVFITGGASGIGKQLVKHFASLGARVVIADLNIEAATLLQEELRNKGQSVFAVQCDVSNRNSVMLAAEATRKQYGNVSILINNAGIVSGKSFMETSIETMERTMKVNTIAHFYTIKEFLPAMIEADKGHIVTIASAAGLSGTGGLVDYCASKFAAVGLDEALRSELRAMNSKVKTTCICPYFINTGMFEGVKLRYTWLFPLLDEGEVGRRIMSAIRHNEPTVVLPGTVNSIFLMRAFLPVSWFDRINAHFGFNQSMSTFNGRGAQ